MPNVDDPSVPTNPLPDEAPTAPDMVPIAAGAAQRTIADAFTALTVALQRAEALAMACARALDGPSGER